MINDIIGANLKSTLNDLRKQSDNIFGYNLFCKKVFPSVKLQLKKYTSSKYVLGSIVILWEDQDDKNNYKERTKSRDDKKIKNTVLTLAVIFAILGVAE